IRMTNPENWSLTKRPGGQEVGYLDDAGCQIVRKPWGIRIRPHGKPEKIMGSAPDDYMYVRSGTGYSRFTGETVKDVEGSRASKERFFEGKTGLLLERDVRKACTANMQGSIVRELAGLKETPIQELEASWTGTTKTTDRCARAHGYGTRDQRLGAETPDAG